MQRPSSDAATVGTKQIARAVVALVVLLAACHSDVVNPSRPASSTYAGVIAANTGEGGRLDLQFSAPLARRVMAAGVNAQVSSGACASICGSAFGALPVTGGSVSGDSVSFTFAGGVNGSVVFDAGGRVSGGRLIGTFASEDKSIAGTFAAFSTTAAQTVSADCGSWQSTLDQNAGGGWYILQANDQLLGWYTNGSDVIRLDGSVNGARALLHAASTGLNAQGDVPSKDGSVMGGAYQLPQAGGGADQGTWSVNACYQGA